MIVECYGEEFEIPDLLIDKFVKDFNSLPGSGFREGICQIRESIGGILDVVTEDPEMLYEPAYLSDFFRALAMRQAMDKLGILYDA